MYQDTGCVTWQAQNCQTTDWLGLRIFHDGVRPVLALYSAFSPLLLSSQMWKWHSVPISFHSFCQSGVLQSPIDNIFSGEYLMITSGDPTADRERSESSSCKTDYSTTADQARPGQAREVFLINYKLGAGLSSPPLLLSASKYLYLRHNILYIINFL